MKKKSWLDYLALLWLIVFLLIMFITIVNFSYLMYIHKPFFFTSEYLVYLWAFSGIFYATKETLKAYWDL
jgi:sensor histidine kinase YesM